MSKPNAGRGPLEVSQDGLIDALPCRGCGAETLSILEIEVVAEVAFWMYLCRPCQAKRGTALEEKRAIFDGLLADGLSAALANAVMMRWHGDWPA